MRTLILFSLLFLPRPLQADEGIMGKAKFVGCADNDRKFCRIMVSPDFIKKAPNQVVGISFFHGEQPVFRVSEILSLKKRQLNADKSYYIVDVVGKWVVSPKDQSALMEKKPLLKYLKIQKKASHTRWASSDSTSPSLNPKS